MNSHPLPQIENPCDTATHFTAMTIYSKIEINTRTRDHSSDCGARRRDVELPLAGAVTPFLRVCAADRLNWNKERRDMMMTAEYINCKILMM